MESVGADDFLEKLRRIDIETDIPIDADPFSRQEESPAVHARLIEKLNQYLGGEYEFVFATLHDGLSYMLTRDEMSRLHKDVQQILAILDMPRNVQANVSDVEAVGALARHDLEQLRTQYDTLAEDLEHYDAFIDAMPREQLVSITDDIHTYDAALFSVHEDVHRLLEREPHPTTSRINMQRELVDGFVDSLETNSARDLNMSVLEHEDLHYYFTDLQDTLGDIPHDYAPGKTSSEHNTAIAPAAAPLLAQQGGGPAASENIAYVDFTQYIE